MCSRSTSSSSRNTASAPGRCSSSASSRSTAARSPGRRPPRAGRWTISGSWPAADGRASLHENRRRRAAPSRRGGRPGRLGADRPARPSCPRAGASGPAARPWPYSRGQEHDVRRWRRTAHRRPGRASMWPGAPRGSWRRPRREAGAETSAACCTRQCARPVRMVSTASESMSTRSKNSLDDLVLDQALQRMERLSTGTCTVQIMNKRIAVFGASGYQGRLVLGEMARCGPTMAPSGATPCVRQASRQASPAQHSGSPPQATTARRRRLRRVRRGGQLRRPVHRDRLRRRPRRDRGRRPLRRHVR